MKVENGHVVQVHYRGTLKDGTEFDNSRVRGKALTFEVGSGRMISGFNDAVLGMIPGASKSITLSPAEAYGPRDPYALTNVPKEQFPEDFEFIQGGTIQGNGPSGPFLAKIHEVTEASVVLDMNHPLAGEELNFDIEMVGVDSKDTTPQLANWNASMRKAELFELAKEYGLKVNTRTTKAQLVEALQTAV
jgi:peptidylprolyl isomerase